SQCCYQICSPC
uniref:Conotoxin Ama1245 n=1 Tax=Conus amadis TaxID=198732 RepID=A1245_CONAA|nr:RecName: Full=Conotoxin Ama1245; Contains: RecName: Full=Conotoxin Ama1158 [Conus amadis]